MDTTETQICRLRFIIKRLKLIGKINVGLMVVLFVLIFVAKWHLSRIAPEDPNPDWRPLHSFQAMLPWMFWLNLVCLGLLFVWGPALMVCSSKLKKLKQLSPGTNPL
jgi:hypothetical protein